MRDGREGGSPDSYTPMNHATRGDNLDATSE